mmetsp:Transcript_9090/g.17340  ORF Transcript_9090/g.17340 Transcript_9090/m.17340 type:complete len:363 (+) Transcript_9090:90-1178(+)
MLLESANVIDCGPNRIVSRCVSWSSSGMYLAFGSSDRLARLYSVEPTQAREVLVISGHQGPVTHVRFHPTEKVLLCTAATDSTVRLWDCRAATQRDVGSIELAGGKLAASVDWCGRNNSGGDLSMSHALAVTERSGSRVVVYDTRKLSTSKLSTGGKTTSASSTEDSDPAILHVSEPRPKEIVETTLFGPGNGKHLICASQLFDNDTTSDLCVWDWTKTAKRTGEGNSADELRFPAHTEAIYAMALSPDGKRLATGGSDSIVGLWDTDTMICTHTVTSRKKYIRAVSFSHDGHILAHGTEENDVELVNARNGKLIGQVSLGHRRGGAEQIAWHPTLPLIACARLDTLGSPVAIAKLNLSAGQ